MRLAASNIAWAALDDGPVRRIMRETGVTGVELAPTAIWPEPADVTDAELTTYRAQWADHGIEIVALQALLFGRGDLAIFADDALRRATLARLEVMMRVAAALGARSLVFGSPKNRLAGARDRAEVSAIAREFFAAAGARAAAHGVALCIEPNPAAYGCDFVNTTRDAVALVRAVGHPGFAVHLDAGALALNGESVGDAIAEARPWLRHFHASEPFLAPLGAGDTEHAEHAERAERAERAEHVEHAEHAACAAALRASGYDGWVSVEMRRCEGADSLAVLRRSLELLAAAYR